MGRQELTSSCGAASDQEKIVREGCTKRESMTRRILSGKGAQKKDQEKIVREGCTKKRGSLIRRRLLARKEIFVL